MTTYYIPNSKVKAQIINPDPKDSYVSLFGSGASYGNENNSSSVNAGTSDKGAVFAVGLGGINGAFATALTQAGQDTSLYQKFHQSLYDRVRGGKLTASLSTFKVTDPIQFLMVQKPAPQHHLPKFDGVVFIDVFNAYQLPNDNLRNASMIYVVPPNRINYPTDAAFYQAINVASMTIIEAVNGYNSKHAVSGNSMNLKPINNIRMCLFSGGIYRENASQEKVAFSNLLGLERGLIVVDEDPNILASVSFENSYDKNTHKNVFESIRGKLVHS